MYAWKYSDMPPDPHFPADLTSLGYMITEDDQVRQISNPDQGFKYRIDRNDRYNVKHREALNECIRTIVIERLLEAGMEINQLPPEADEKVSEGILPHVPILVSKYKGENAKPARILVLFGDPQQDVGIWSNRGIDHDGINEGSAVSFVKAFLADAKNRDTLLVLANSAQLVWHNATERAMTIQTWESLDREYGPLMMPPIGDQNKIPKNEDIYWHVHSIFEDVVKPKLGEDTMVEVICVAESGLSTLQYLKDSWWFWRRLISCICFADPVHSTDVEVDLRNRVDPDSIESFLEFRCRAYILSEHEAGIKQLGFSLYGCNCYSAGEALNADCIMIRAWPDMLAWLDQLHENPNYIERAPGAINVMFPRLPETYASQRGLGS